MSSLPDAALNRPHYLYRCFAADGSLLYVGVARNVGARIFHHTHPCNIGKQPNRSLRLHLADYTADLHPTKVAAREAERRTIRDEAPLLNRQHNPRRFRKVNRATYGLVAPVHPLTAEAFPELSTIVAAERAA